MNSTYLHQINQLSTQSQNSKSSTIVLCCVLLRYYVVYIESIISS